MPEIVLNDRLLDIFARHSISANFDDEFVYPDLPSKAKFKARAVYSEINGTISSQLDVMIIADTGEKIIECFGDTGPDIDTALSRNLTYFCISILHPLLALFGITDPEIIHHAEIDEWVIDDKTWTVYMGNLIPKTNSANYSPPQQFFDAIEAGIRSQKLINKLHWFRGFYLQYETEIKATEFLMDNIDITKLNPLFADIPVIPGVSYASCRNFVILKQKH